VLFFGLVLSVGLPWKFSADALGMLLPKSVDNIIEVKFILTVYSR